MAVRQSGSHVVLKSPHGRRVTVPVHAGRDLGRALLRPVGKPAGIVGISIGSIGTAPAQLVGNVLVVTTGTPAQTG